MRHAYWWLQHQAKIIKFPTNITCKHSSKIFRIYCQLFFYVEKKLLFLFHRFVMIILKVKDGLVLWRQWNNSFCIFWLILPLGFPDGLGGKASACDAAESRSIPESERSSREGNGNPLQYSSLENPMDGGAYEAALHGVSKSRTRLSDFTFLGYTRKTNEKLFPFTFYEQHSHTTSTRWR